MRPVQIAVVAVVAGAAAAIAATMWRGECVGGAVVADEAACIAAGLPIGACGTAFMRADEVARATGPLYNTRQPCEERYPVCIEAKPGVGFVPKPAGFCVVADRAGTLGRLTPVYRVGG